MLNIADFDQVYKNKPQNAEMAPIKPQDGFIGSYPPVAKPGEMGSFFVNTYLLQPNRKMEVAGTVSVRSEDLRCKK